MLEYQFEVLCCVLNSAHNLKNKSNNMFSSGLINSFVADLLVCFFRQTGSFKMQEQCQKHAVKTFLDRILS